MRFDEESFHVETCRGRLRHWQDSLIMQLPCNGQLCSLATESGGQGRTLFFLRSIIERRRPNSGYNVQSKIDNADCEE